MIYGYARGSTNSQMITVEAQREKVRAYCETQGLDLDDVYADEGVSSRIKLEDREQGSLLWDQIKGKEVTDLVIVKLDRAFRNVVETLTFVEQIQKYGCKLHIIDLNGMSVNLDSSMGKMMLTIMAAFAEFERNLISERTSAALKHAQANGKRVTSRGRVPYGYKAADVKCKECKGKGCPVCRMKGYLPTIVDNEQEQACIAAIIKIREETGAGARVIARQLDGLGFEPRTRAPDGGWNVRLVHELIKRHCNDIKRQGGIPIKI